MFEGEEGVAVESGNFFCVRGIGNERWRWRGGV